MIRMINWLNTNSGAIQAISTLALVAITGWYAFLTFRLSKAARDQVELLARQNNSLLRERVAQVVTYANKILAVLSSLDRRPITLEVDQLWSQGWLYLEQLGRSLDNPPLLELLEQALDARRILKVYLASGESSLRYSESLLVGWSCP